MDEARYLVRRACGRNSGSVAAEAEAGISMGEISESEGQANPGLALSLTAPVHPYPTFLSLLTGCGVPGSHCPQQKAALGLANSARRQRLGWSRFF
jgi:hypothetical protein